MYLPFILDIKIWWLRTCKVKNSLDATERQYFWQLHDLKIFWTLSNLEARLKRPLWSFKVCRRLNVNLMFYKFIQMILAFFCLMLHSPIKKKQNKTPYRCDMLCLLFLRKLRSGSIRYNERLPQENNSGYPWHCSSAIVLNLSNTGTPIRFSKPIDIANTVQGCSNETVWTESIKIARSCV